VQDKFDEELRTKIQAGIPLIQVVSYEWMRVHAYTVKAARENERIYFVWNNVDGLSRWDQVEKKLKEEKPDMTEITDVLQYFYNSKDGIPNESILLMDDPGAYFESQNAPRILGYLKLIARQDSDKTLIMYQPFQRIPQGLEKDVHVMELPLSDKTIFKDVFKDVVTSLDLETYASKKEDIEKIAEATLGLTMSEAENAFKEVAIREGKLTTDEIPEIISYKEQIIKKSGTLEYFHPQETIADIGGMENLKEWLDKRKSGFEPDAKDHGLTPPKGVLLLGIQGCGKSLIAKAIASMWNKPLLKFDLGRVYGSYLGQSEENIRRALDMAKAISPCVLWIDEIEKALSGMGSSNETDGGTTSRIFGTLLTWMQEKKEPVFVIATANNILALPPELLRKGRFDEIFFVDLPGAKSRKEIFEIHLSKRLGDAYPEVKKTIDFDKLVENTRGFSGAEIEEAINDALYTAFNDNKRIVKTEDILKVIERTYPLSKTMGENLKDLRSWAKSRVRMASNDEVEDIPIDDDTKRLKSERFSYLIK
jgi:SpoVK/Ycf46/Vps4 family AAA+-type ATPase